MKTTAPITEYLTTLFGDVDRGYLVLIHNPKPWSGTAYEKIEDAVQGVDPDTRQYCSLGIFGKRPPPGKRGYQRDVIGITSVWCDIDIDDPENPVHKKPNLAPTVDEALKVIEGLPKPSLVVNSGHGIHAYWIFREPWYFPDDEERDQARDFLSKWTDTIRERAKRLGYEADATKDLSRVLRIPGTINDKGAPVYAEIIENNGTRYDQSELSEHFEQTTNGQLFKQTKKIQRPSGETNIAAKILLVCQADPDFDRIWKRQADFSDQSASSYDMSICTRLIQSGWSDGDAWDAARLWRQNHGEDTEKLDRQDYQSSTIRKARSYSDPIKPAKPSSEHERQDRIGDLEQDLGIRILNIIRILGEEISFRFTIEDDNGKPQSFELTAHQLSISCTALRAKALGHGRVLMKKLKGDGWDRILSEFLALATDLDLGDEGTILGTVKTQLESWIRTKSFPSDVDKDEIPPRGHFKFNGKLWFSVTDFANFMKLKNINLTNPQIVKNLKLLGLENRVFNIKKPQKTSRSVWGFEIVISK